MKEEMLMDLDGKLHKYDGIDEHPISKHYEIAHKLLPDNNKPLDSLMDIGWVVIGSKFLATYSGKEPNQAQINALYDINIKYIHDFYNQNISWKIF